MWVVLWCPLWSKLVEEVVQGWDSSLQSLSLSYLLYQFCCLRALFKWVTVDDLPVVKDALREGFALGGTSEMLSEAEALSNWKIALHNGHRRSAYGFFWEDSASALRHDLVDAADKSGRCLDLTQEHRFLEARLCCEFSCVYHTPSCWDDLSSSSVDSVSDQVHIHKV